MKSFKLNILLLVGAVSLLFASCSAEYWEEMNSDPSKATTLDPNAQLTTAQLQTYGDLGMVEIYRNYHYAFSQYLMGCWNTTNYGGRHTKDNNEMSRVWNSFYQTAIKNLTDGMVRSAEDPDTPNIHAITSIYRVYLMSIITDIYGDVPYSEAGYGYIGGKFTPKYDSQEEIYNSFFEELATAVTEFDPAKDKVTGDVIYNGNLESWKKLANSLRLRFAMRISNVDPEKAKAEFEAALTADGGVMTGASDDALIKYMSKAFSFGQDSYSDYRGNAMSQLLFGNDPSNNPSYVCSTFFNEMYTKGDPRALRIARCYADELMSATSPDNRIDITDEVISKNMLQPVIPGGYSWEPWPSGYDSDLLKAMQESNPKITKITMDRETMPKLANNFLKGDNPGVVMTYAEVSLLMAEAKEKGWTVSGTVEDLYWAGVRAAMDFLTDNYGCDPVSATEFDAYKAANHIGMTSELRLRSINTQAWILHFTNPAEGWSNVRRSGYPALKSPSENFSTQLIDGQDIPVRLCYPTLEASYNKANYDLALELMGGRDDWYSPVWWDNL